MMIEAVPFFHIICNVITAKVGEDQPDVIIATTMVSFAFSAILTGQLRPLTSNRPMLID